MDQMILPSNPIRSLHDGSRGVYDDGFTVCWRHPDSIPKDGYRWGGAAVPEQTGRETLLGLCQDGSPNTKGANLCKRAPTQVAPSREVWDAPTRQALRDALNGRSSEVARCLGVTVDRLRAWLRGENAAPAGMLERLRGAL